MNNRTLSKALDILELLSVRSSWVTLNAIVGELGFAKSTTHNLLQTLTDRGYLERSTNKEYRLSIKLFQVGSQAIERMQVKSESITYLKQLARDTGETAHLAVLVDSQIVILEKVESTQSIRASSAVGTTLALHAPATAKVILSYASETERECLLSAIEYDAYSPNTITEEADLLFELTKTRERGYGIDDEEISLGTRCVAAPIFDYSNRVIAAIGVTGPSSRITKSNLHVYGRAVMHVAKSFSNALGSTLQNAQYATPAAESDVSSVAS